MKTIKIMMMMAALTLAWGCSSDSDESNKWNGSVYTPSLNKPTWAVDWSSNETMPDWQNPSATAFECSMDLSIRLSEQLGNQSTDNDRMGIFIGDECRGMGLPNKLSTGRIVFLIHVSASSKETGEPLELRYYCDGWHHLSKTMLNIPFKPNDVQEPYERDLDISEGSTKYPVATSVTVVVPQQLPFTTNAGDMLAVFVGNECRGVGMRSAEDANRWSVTVYGSQTGETAQIRYYSAEKNGIYALLKTIQLTGQAQEENISF